ncbi:hypothetical protein ERO13_D13G114550v2 [Gossypium hirsutum]|nr:hypothetical protein ERO13_D13G114550v2 [Gossypium hirsutum]
MRAAAPPSLCHHPLFCNLTTCPLPPPQLPSTTSINHLQRQTKTCKRNNRKIGKREL